MSPPGSDPTPWTVFRRHARSIVIALATCLVVLTAFELAIFRSGFFVTHMKFSTPDSPATKLALAAQQTDTRVLYVGDSTVMTGVLPDVVASVCRCGPGFNAGFRAASPTLTDAMTMRVLELIHPEVVVIGVSPWQFDRDPHFALPDFARDSLASEDLYVLDTPVDLSGKIDKVVGSLWSSYGQRLLIKDWLRSLVPSQRYDESHRGYYLAPGSATSPAQLLSGLNAIFRDATQPSETSPGAAAVASLISALRARGIAVAIMVPPIHPFAYEHVGPYLEREELAIQAFVAAQRVSLIDCRSTIALADYRDAYHVLEAGAMKQSTCIGERLRALASG
jgi:hypothetical protein